MLPIVSHGLEDGGRALEIVLQHTGGPSVDHEFWKVYLDCVVSDELGRGISGIIEVLSWYSPGGAV
jgi:hypothetical protein